MTLALGLGGLPPGQLRVVLALIGGGDAPTYAEVAEELGLHLGSVHQHLRRVRRRHSEVYRRLMRFRRGQLDARHQEALARAREHSHAFFRRMARYRFATATAGH